MGSTIFRGPLGNLFLERVLAVLRDDVLGSLAGQEVDDARSQPHQLHLALLDLLRLFLVGNDQAHADAQENAAPLDRRG